MFQKIDTIKVSEWVFDLVNSDLFELVNVGKKLNGHYEVFNNCREQGLLLVVYSTNYDNPNHAQNHLYVWVYEHRNNNSICVTIDTRTAGCNGLFPEEAWHRTKFFVYDNEHEAAEYVVNSVSKFFYPEEE